MKLLLLILPLIFSQIISAQYQDVPASEYEHDVQIQAALYYGAWDTVVGGIKSGSLPPSTFEVSQTFRVQRQLVAGFNFQFDVELSNGEMTVNANYVVYSQAGTSSLTVTSSSLAMTSASNELPLLLPPQEGGGTGAIGIPGGYNEVDVTTLNTDSDLRDILSFGVQNAIVQGIDEGNVPDADYFIDNVDSIETQVVQGENYRFNVTLGDDEGNEIAISFVVYVPLDGERQFTGYEVLAPEEGTILGGWKSIDVNDVLLDPTLYGIFDYGVEQVISEGVASGLLSGDYQVSELYSAKSQLVNGMNYRFSVLLENGEDGAATAIFVVYVTRDGTKSVSLYYFTDVQESGDEETDEESPSGTLIDGGAFD